MRKLGNLHEAPLCVAVVVSIKTWNANPDPVGPFDEHFWHATSLANARAIRNAPLIDPSRGKGANGPGFYVCTRISDYQKAMVLRNDDSDHAYLYLLYVRVTNFWRLNPYFSEGFAGDGSEGERSDVIAAMWGPDNTGSCGNKHPNGNYACYEEYQSQQMRTPGWDLPLLTVENRATIVRASGRAPAYIGRSLMRDARPTWAEMWRLANLPSPPTGALLGLCPSLYDAVIALMDGGASARVAIRCVLLSAMEELAFKNQQGPISVGSRICVVGARRFGKLVGGFDADQPITLADIP